MQKSLDMIRAYVSAGFTKLHLDCSIRLGGDPPGPLDPALLARRAALLARAAEESAVQAGRPGTLRYVIGTEVPTPGGALAHEDGVAVTRVEDVSETIDLHRQAFYELGLQSAWERVIAAVVQPGVEFGDDFVLPYRPEKTRELTAFIQGQGLVYEAHSTDYQTAEALRELVRGRFAILKVGPALTFAYREAIFALALMEDELVPAGSRSNIMTVLEEVMLRQPQHWRKYYSGSPAEQAFKRRYSLSDRIRYYWTQSEVQHAQERLMNNLSAVPLPLTVVSQFAPREKATLLGHGLPLTAANIISVHISTILEDYWSACQTNPIP
jgi:D-tagatose-1,6-bisphosphate aldolase subunit GatZ/KbaZ